MHEFFHDVVLHALEECARLLPFLFLTYLLMEWLEHRASERTTSLLSRAGRFAPPLGALLGVVPQCGFSTVASNLYSARLVTAGTLVAVFLSTSDEMLPLLLGGSLPLPKVLAILGYKVLVAIVVGLVLDLVLSLSKREEESHVHELCESEGCHCEGGILRSATVHTVKIALFLLVSIMAINLVVFLVGEEPLRELLSKIGVLGHLVCALVGLVPNCAVSVLLTQFYLDGYLSAGAMLAGLLPGAGVGILVLCRMNRPKAQTVRLLLLLVGVGILFGLLADAPFLAPLFAI